MRDLHEQFANPDAAFRGKPFWSWNGKLEKEELIRQVHVMKEMGFGGFFMHSRTGLATEYLGEEWFELIGACAEEAEKLGMEAWLYDEDRWPSGSAGGLVTMEPKYRMKYIYLEVLGAERLRWEDDMIAAFACDLEGVDFYDCVRIDRDTPVQFYEKRNILVFRIVEMGKSTFYNGYTYADTLNREATERFLELTHEKYKAFCGKKFGKSIKGIFTDEPHRGALMNGISVFNDNSEWHVPWTYEAFGKFKDKFGYDLVPRLPELFLRKDGQSVSQVKWHYVELLQQLFLENFAQPLNEWCERNDLILTGHILHEDNLTVQTAMSGSVMRYYEYMGYPGVDVLQEGNESYWIVKQLASAANQLGKKWLLSELYGCTGWQMSFENHKAVGDWQALFGINLRCHHLSWYTMEGEAKRDYPASILHQSAWWQEYAYVEEYFARIGVAMSQGKSVCETLVINPVESVWCQVYPKWAYWPETFSDNVQKLEDQYRDLFHWLTGSQIDFDYGDEEMISRLYRIDRDSSGRPILRVGEAAYLTVIVAGMTTIRSTTLRVIDDFIAAGGKAIFAGEAPAYVDALKSGAARDTAGNSVAVPFERKAVVEAWRLNTTVQVQVTDSMTDLELDNIFCRIMDDGTRKIAFLINVNREEEYRHVRIKLRGTGFAEEWDAATGIRVFAAQDNGEGSIEIVTSFPASGSRLYVITPEKHLNEKEVGFVECGRLSLTQTSYPFELSEPNVCVLDRASYQIEDEGWQNAVEILKADRAIRGELGFELRNGEMIQPWFAALRGETRNKRRIRLRYEFVVKELPDQPVELAMENPWNFSIKLNESSISVSRRTGWWIDKCFQKIAIELYDLVIGKNTIELETQYDEGTGLEAIYLLGSFGVELDGSTKIIARMKERIEIGDLTIQGFPFYGGAITYKMDVPSRTENNEKAFLSFDSFKAACIKVRPSDCPSTIVAWEPYEAEIPSSLEANISMNVELILTRRNTFGPLHQVPLYPPWYGPDNFITEGDSFTDSYMLIPSGLLQPPEIVVKTRDICEWENLRWQRRNMSFAGD